MTDREQDWIAKYRAAIECQSSLSSAGYLTDLVNSLKETVRSFFASLRETGVAANSHAHGPTSSNAISPGKLSPVAETIPDIEKAS